jgi:hypothetical protein
LAHSYYNSPEIKFFVKILTISTIALILT